MAKLKDAHPILRPREKLIRYGVDRLSNAELLALLLRSGTKKVSSVELAQHILDSFDELSIQQLTTESLCKIDGIGRAKACEIIACFELGRRFLKDKKATLLLTPQDIFD